MVLGWEDLFVVGAALDIAGALTIARSLIGKRPDEIATEVPIHGMTFGMPYLAKSQVIQRSEAMAGAALLASGFLFQIGAYLTPEANGAPRHWSERVAALAIALAVLLVSEALAIRFITWHSQRTWPAVWLTHRQADARIQDPPPLYDAGKEPRSIIGRLKRRAQAPRPDPPIES